MCPAIQYDDMPKGSNQTDLSSYAATLDGYEREYLSEIEYKQELCKEIRDCIEKMERENEKDVLVYRYIELRTWEDIAVRMNYSWQHVHKIHSNALKNFIICDSMRPTVCATV